MPSLSKLSIIFLLLLLFAFLIPTHSQSTKFSRRNLALIDQEVQEQPTSLKSPIKKKKLSLLDQEQEEDLKVVKKKKTTSNEQEQEVAPKPLKTKKLVSSEQEKEVMKLVKKKKIASNDQEQEEDPKPVKKKKTALMEEEDPKPAVEKKKNALMEEEDPKPVKKKQSELEEDPKPVKKKKLLVASGQDEIKPNQKTVFDSSIKNQTKPAKLKKSNSTSISIEVSSKTLNSSSKINKPTKPMSSNSVQRSKPINPIWDEPEDSDLISEFRDLPTRIHQAFLPDLKKISITSKAYIYKANKNIEKNMKPYVGNEYAPKIALAASCVFLVLPLCLVTALLYQLNSYLSLQSFLIFVQAYLAIYFFTLAVTAVVTGLEPLRFFYATSKAYYTWTQAVQTLGYLLYLLVQLIHLVVVFSVGENKRSLALVQMMVGLAVGCHYYNAVFHRAVTGEPPRANWKVHGAYAMCFLVICFCARAERSKKAYDGGEDGKKS